jgi:hypothetical protein
MVAASIHGLALSLQGTSAPPDRNTASSQGGLMETMDAIQGGFGPKTDPEWLRGKGGIVTAPGQIWPPDGPMCPLMAA